MSVPRFLLDEHVWGGLVDVGQEIGVDVLLVQTRLPIGTDDEEVLAFAASQGRILLTSNAQDFARSTPGPPPPLPRPQHTVSYTGLVGGGRWPKSEAPPSVWLLMTLDFMLIVFPY